MLLDAYRRILIDRITERMRVVEQRLSRVKGDEQLEKDLIGQTLQWQALRTRALNAHSFAELPPLDE